MAAALPLLSSAASVLTPWALLLLRVVWGYVMFQYARPMIRRPFRWMDDAGQPGTPHLLQAAAAATMAGGSLSVLFGLLGRLGALGLAGVMAVAFATHLRAHHPLIKRPPDAPGESSEASLVYVVLALLLAVLGPGRLSVDGLLGLA